MNQAALFTSPEPMATYSINETHRYTLTRLLGASTVVGADRVLFVMLNPSTATADIDDPTIRRCMGFARSWGFGRLDVANLFSLRSTDPAALYRTERPTGGPANDQHIMRLAMRAGLVVCAWGTHGEFLDRGRDVRLMLRAIGPVHHLGLTKAGHPKHPLYLRSATKPAVWE